MPSRPIGITLIPWIGLNEWLLTFDQAMVDPIGTPAIENFIVLINGSPPIPNVWTAWTQNGADTFIITPLWTDPSTPGDIWSIEQINQDFNVQSAVTGLLAFPWGPVIYENPV